MEQPRFARPLLPYLRSVVSASDEGPRQTPELRAALDALRCASRTDEGRAAAEYFWDSAGSPHEIGRQQSMRASLNRILFLMGLPGE